MLPDLGLEIPVALAYGLESGVVADAAPVAH